MARFEVNGKSVEGVDLLRRRHWTARLDFWPFLALYALWLLLAVPALDFTDALVILGVLSAFHILAFLFTAWSVDFRAFVGHSKVKDVHAANACKVIPAKFLGSKEIVPLHIQKTVAPSSASGETEEIYFDFRKQRFFYSAEKDNFFKLRYPTKDLFGHYIKGTGYGTEAKVNTAVDKWGRNIFEYPQPTFQKLMKEQCMEPFFVFQVFCVGLWCLDEYWYYSLFTLFMLFLFESTMAKNRLKTLTELRRVKVDNQIVLTYRCGKWVKITGTELLPGDIVSIGRSSSGEDRSVDICCFDKTGTLTSDDMEFQGVVSLEGDDELISDANKLPLRIQEALSSCHALVFVDNKLVGDPLEKAAIKGIDWIYTSDEKAMSRRPGGQPVQIVHRYHFASHLKRMSVIVRIQEKFYAFIKGAPETIQERLVDLPPAYVETYKKYTRQGSRVLSLAYKLLPEMPVSEARSLERDQVESDLIFAGFAVFNCPIRSDSAAVLLELEQSSHDLVMITGDQVLTACHVGSQVNICSKPVLILTKTKSSGFEWVSPDETDRAPYRAEEVKELSESHDLCISGDCFELLQRTEAVLQVIPHVKKGS
uniref:Uncharacterized protein n=2 Tax=Avena sativa TaxID=4498 RepID=A0ACD5THA0_AVESA